MAHQTVCDNCGTIVADFHVRVAATPKGKKPDHFVMLGMNATSDYCSWSCIAIAAQAKTERLPVIGHR